MTVSWLIPALFAPVIYTCSIMIDKYVVEKEVKDYRGMPLFGSVVGVFIGLVFWVIADFPVLPMWEITTLILSGMLSLAGAAFYFKAISADDASKLIILFQVTPVFVLTLSTLFLGERISLVQLGGFSLIMLATLGASDDFSKRGFQISKTFWLVMLVNLMWALAAVFAKLSLNQTSYLDALPFESWGRALGGLVLAVVSSSTREAFIKSVRRVRRLALGIIVGNEVLFIVGNSASMLAASLGLVSLVSAVGSTQVFMGILFGLLLTRFAPHIIKEDISKRTLIKKMVLALVAFGGLLLLG